MARQKHTTQSTEEALKKAVQAKSEVLADFLNVTTDRIYCWDEDEAGRCYSLRGEADMWWYVLTEEESIQEAADLLIVRLHDLPKPLLLKNLKKGMTESALDWVISRKNSDAILKMMRGGERFVERVAKVIGPGKFLSSSNNEYIVDDFRIYDWSN